MANIFTKALGLFVEFEPDTKPVTSNNQSHLPKNVSSTDAASFANTSGAVLTKADMDKFSKHFEELFDKANLPGPDYYEFWKMMETLEAAVPDEKVRMSAVYATLKVQGLSKETLLSSANTYQQVIKTDKQEFEVAVNTKVMNDVQGRKKLIDDLEKTNAVNAERMKQLSEEIAANQSKIAVLEREIINEEQKITVNSKGYHIACDAMISMIAEDIQKINTNL